MLKKFSAAIAALAFTLPTLAQDDSFGEWITLFNGKDLTGWQNAKPHSGRHKGPNRWTVDNGSLTNISRGVNDICTIDEYGDYELEIEYKIGPKGNSGVYLRGQIEIQIYDSHWKIKENKPVTSADAGAIYGGNFPALKNVQKAVGKWNKFRVLHVGSRITVWHNGVLIQDNVYQNSRTGGSMSHYPASYELSKFRGPLMLQGDHEKVWYRNIRLRPLLGAGWKSLWNGKDMSTFTARGDKRAEKGLRWAINADTQEFWNTATGGGGHDIWTKESFGNFLAYYCYRSDTDVEGDKSGNSGFYLRDQWEIQIHAGQDTKNKHSDGSLYSIRSPSVHSRHGKHQWNHVFVKLVGQKITVWQNGHRIHKDIVLPTRTDNHGVKTPDFSRAPFKLQGDHGKVIFSQLWIKPLSDYVLQDK
ncbi:MAG: DUF1080 domain-containing protein [Planctomycetota bacterium]